MRRFAFGLVILLAACGGGGSGGSAGRATPQMGRAVLNLVIAGSNSGSSTSTASSARHVLYVDPLTQSVAVVVNGSAPQVTNVGSGAPNCTATAGSTGIACAVDISAPYGNDTFAISLYSGANATGSVIGTASASGDVSFGAPFVISATVSTNYTAYLPLDTSGIDLFSEAGVLQSTLSFNASIIALDDAGNVYDIFNVTTNPITSTTLERYAPGSTTPNATYAPSATDLIDWVSENGELAALNFGGSNSFGMDVWNPGVTGPPSYTLTAPQNEAAGYVCPATAVGRDGSVYLPQYNGVNNSWAVYPPGSTTPTRTITETLVNPAEFCSNNAVVGPDGTLYVTEYTAIQPDPNTGLYVFPPSGPEEYFATTTNANGGGAQGIDIDGAGNIYVANSNWWISNVSPLTYQPDTLHDVEVFSPSGTVLRHITGNFDPEWIGVAADGTLFVSSISVQPGGVSGTFVVQPGSTTATEISPQSVGDIAFFDGVQSGLGFRRHNAAQNAAIAVMHAGGAAMEAYLRKTHRIP